MSEATEKKESQKAGSELELPMWSVVSFDKTEASKLTYAEAVRMMAEKEEAGVYGLCIVTDEVASKVG